MHLMLTLLLACLIGDDRPARPVITPLPTVPRTAPSASPGAMVAFEVRDIRVSSPEWRGKFMLRMQPVARHEGAAVWSLDAVSFRALLEHCQADARMHIVQAPKMTARVGDPARMTSEEALHYIATLKRVADGPPGQSTKLAFEPQVDTIHSGVRINVESSEIQGGGLLAKVVIEENRLVAMYTARYTETVQPKPGTDSDVSKASFLERLSPNHGPHPAALNATFQVPEVDSRRVEGRWLIPADGALVVSMGPRSVHDRGFVKSYEEHLIAITARLETSPVVSPPAGTTTLPSIPGTSAPVLPLPRPR